jgi:hypothetical protein
MRFNHRGAFMGTTGFGGPYGYGVVYELVKQNGVWQEILLHSFVGSDGDQLASGLVTDRKAAKDEKNPNPQPNPQNAMSYTTSAYLGIPRGLVSRCKA